MHPVGIAIFGARDAGRQLAAASYRIACDYKDDEEAPNLMTIVDEDGAKAAELARQFQFTQWNVEWPVVLDDQEVHVAVLSGKDQGHLARAAAKAGKHLHLECHPFDRTIDDELIRTVDRMNVRVNVSYRHFSNPSIVLLRDMAVSQELGAIVRFRARLAADTSISCAAGLSEQSLPRDDSLKSTFLGVLAVARLVVGEISSIWFPASSQPSDGRQVMIRFECGANGVIDLCDAFLGAKPSFQFEIQGTHGAAAFNTYEPGFIRYQKRNGTLPSSEPCAVYPTCSHFPSNVHWEFRSPHFSSVELKAIELATFIGSKEASSLPVAGLRDARRLQELINAALADARSHPFGL